MFAFEFYAPSNDTNLLACPKALANSSPFHYVKGYQIKWTTTS